MESCEVYYKDVFLGVLKVDQFTGNHEYTPDKEGVQKVKANTFLIREMVEGTEGFIPPIPFFQNRLMNMKRSGLNEIRYHTDYFLIKK